MDGNALASVDLAEINHAPLPARLPAGHQAVIPLKAKSKRCRPNPQSCLEFTAEH